MFSGFLNPAEAVSREPDRSRGGGQPCPCWQLPTTAAGARGSATPTPYKQRERNPFWSLRNLPPTLAAGVGSFLFAMPEEDSFFLHLVGVFLCSGGRLAVPTGRGQHGRMRQSDREPSSSDSRGAAPAALLATTDQRRRDAGTHPNRQTVYFAAEIARSPLP